MLSLADSSQTEKHLADPCTLFIRQLYFFAFISCISLLFSAVFLCFSKLYFSDYVSCVFADCWETREHLADPGRTLLALAGPASYVAFMAASPLSPRNAKSLRPTSFSNISNDVQYPERDLSFQTDLTRESVVTWWHSHWKTHSLSCDWGLLSHISRFSLACPNFS